MKIYSLEEIRKKYPRAYENWDETEDRELISQFERNLPTGEIAVLHKRKREAIRARLLKLGLIQRGQRRP